jgi:transcriptional regulator with XRE-family HTH domain
MNISPQKLKTFIFQHEKSMQAFADKVGYSGDTIRRMCSGKYKITNNSILRIAGEYPDIVEFFPDETLSNLVMETTGIYGKSKSEKVRLVKQLQEWYKKGDQYIDRLKEVLMEDDL